MFKCFIIDDEPIAIRVIKKHLAAFKQFEVVGEFNNAIDAMGKLPERGVDLIFCDIQMPQITGTEFVKALRHPPQIIFTTAYRNYAVEAFELNVVDYLLKPISFERFAKGVNKFLDNKKSSLGKNLEDEKKSAQEGKYIFLKADKKHLKVDLDDILYFESLGDYIIAYCQDKKITTKETISHMVEILPPYQFLRIHRSFIVSIANIEAVGSGFVEVNKKKLPVGRNFKNSLNDLMSKS